MTLASKLARSGPRKLLALDGGGIHGLITIEFIARIEAILRAELGAGDDFVLADYFDYIAGTSTGAIIATCLAWGMRVDEVREFYLANGRAMFRRSPWLQRHLSKYRQTELGKILQDVLGARTTLGTERLRTLLMMVLRNATTDSPWPVTNNPAAKYNDRERPDCNLDLPLWQLVRASTAAPTFFPPEVVTVGTRRFVFVDGAVSVYNNPSFLSFLMATLRAYRLNWPTGERQMLLVSVGSGSGSLANPVLQPSAMHLLYHATRLPLTLIASSATEQDLLCRVFGHCVCGDLIDSEVDDLQGDSGLGAVDPKLFTYARYDVALTQPGLEAVGITGVRADRLARLDIVGAMDDLCRVGQAAAKRVQRDHFASFLS